MTQLINLIRPDLWLFSPYRSARDEAKQGTIWLNANESPFDFEWQTNVKLNRYPEKQSTELIMRLSALFQVASEEIAVARGSDEMIDLLIRLFCTFRKDAILTCTPTYGMYAVYAQLQGAKVIEVPLLKENNFQLDVASILKRVREKKVKIIFLCSPNNPTGNSLRQEDILFLCESVRDTCMVIVDEAYIDFADSVSLSGYLNTYANLVILRTMSKAYGLANIRLGMALANKEIIQWILKISAPYPLSTLVTKLAIDTISPLLLPDIQQEIACIKAERSRVMRALEKMPFIKKQWPSDANFILIEADNALEIMDVCKQHGIVLRSMFDKMGLKNAIRIGIGRPEENTQLIDVLQRVAAC